MRHGRQEMAGHPKKHKIMHIIHCVDEMWHFFGPDWVIYTVFWGCGAGVDEFTTMTLLLFCCWGGGGAYTGGWAYTGGGA